jgi:DNA-binding transcriptional MerR regulator
LNFEVSKTRPQGLRISELARRADVPHATIQHYVRERLLPAPAKTGRTMAYYDAGCVERIALIKELQQRHLPLGVIRRLLDVRGPSRETDARVMSEIGLAVQRALAPEERALSPEEVTTQLGLPRDVVAELEEEGVVSSASKGVFPPHDVAILRALSRLARAGLNRAAGFRAKDLAIYEEAMRNLVAAEVGKFLQRAGTAGAGEDVIRLGVAAATCATDLIVALRHKYIAQTLAGMAPKPARKGKTK